MSRLIDLSNNVELISGIIKQLQEHLRSTEPSVNCSGVIKTLYQIKVREKIELLDAFHYLNQKYKWTKRVHVPITMHECRQLLNESMLRGVAQNLQLITLDGDGTLYKNGQTFQNEAIGRVLVEFLKENITIAIITAANYSDNLRVFEFRLQKLLDIINSQTSDRVELRRHFWIVSGECHDIMRLSTSGALELVPDEDWQHFSELSSYKSLPDIAKPILQFAEKQMTAIIDKFDLPCLVIRKKYCVGIIAKPAETLNAGTQAKNSLRIHWEILEEIAQQIRASLIDLDIEKPPYCVFNGLTDVWVDIGNKGIASNLLQKLLNVQAENCLHFGDQFGKCGNDFAVYKTSAFNIVYSVNETLSSLNRLKDLRNSFN